MEAVSTLIFAAARFPDLPELCDLRRVFSERYGSYMESSVNTEFVEKIQKKTFSTEKKMRLMQEIAQEFAVTWDFKAFEQKISNSSAPTEEIKKLKASNVIEGINAQGNEKDDILTQVLGKERHGHVRGMGWGVTSTTTWGPSKETRSNEKVEWQRELQELKALKEELQPMIDHLRRKKMTSTTSSSQGEHYFENEDETGGD